MLISKRSRRKSDSFESRFRDGSAGDFPLRQYLRCREDFSSGVVHAVLTIVFILTLLGFGRTLGHLFDSHGAALNPSYKWLTLAMVGIFVLSVLRRLYYKVMDLREMRREMAHLQTVIMAQEEELDED